MKPWDEMTENERDEANELSYANAADRVRQIMRADSTLDIDAAKRAAETQLLADMREENRIIRRAERSRATKADKRSARFSRDYLQSLSLQHGFIFDVEI